MNTSAYILTKYVIFTEKHFVCLKCHYLCSAMVWRMQFYTVRLRQIFLLQATIQTDQRQKIHKSYEPAPSQCCRKQPV